MDSESLRLTEAQSAAVAVAPRVKLSDIEGAIDHTFYFSGLQVRSGVPVFPTL
jgi:hypothetical protein